MAQRSNRIGNVVSAITARAKLGQILKRASERDERFMVDRREGDTLPTAKPNNLDHDPSCGGHQRCGVRQLT